MGSLYVVSGRGFYRAFSIATDESSDTTSIHHAIDNARSYLDQVWPYAAATNGDTQQPSSHADGRVGDMAAIIVSYEDATYKRKVYKRNFGVGSEYSWTEETE
jgi:hypothetical protein